MSKPDADDRGAEATLGRGDTVAERVAEVDPETDETGTTDDVRDELDL